MADSLNKTPETPTFLRTTKAAQAISNETLNSAKNVKQLGKNEAQNKLLPFQDVRQPWSAREAFCYPPQCRRLPYLEVLHNQQIPTAELRLGYHREITAKFGHRSSNSIENGFAAADLRPISPLSAIRNEKKYHPIALTRSAGIIKELADKNLYPLLNGKTTQEM